MLTRFLAVAAAATAALSGFAVPAASQGQDAVGSAQSMNVRQATVTVDFSRSRGELSRTERFNTWDNGDPEPDLRESDVTFLVDQGLRSDIIRIGIGVDGEMCDLEAQSCDFSRVGWIFDVSKLTESLVVHLTPEGLFEPGRKPADLRPLLTLAVRELKEQVPNVDYIEAFNEPDWVNFLQQVRAGKTPDVLPGQLYRWYVPFYQAVNAVNEGLHPNERIRVGGPTLMSFEHEGWIPAFLDGYASDPDPDKRLDFISWHGYGYFDKDHDYRAYVMFKDDPSMVATQRARLDAMLEERGLTTYIPAFVTETGIYPGPSFDDRDPSRNDWIRQASGVASLHYWWLGQRNIYPFHWTVRHAGEGRKDQLVTLRGDGEASPTGTFTPYGNLLVMQSMLRDQRVAAESDALKAGKGIYAIATKDAAGAAVLVWNYQGTDSQTFDVTVDMENLPAALRGKSLIQRQYRIDHETSNYWANPATANLQQVSQDTVSPRDSREVAIKLTPNALQLITLDPQ